VQQRSRKRTAGRARPASQPRLSRKAGTPADKLAPEDQALREFIADLYAALSIMRLLRGQIGRTLALSSAQFSVLLGVWHLERRGEPTVKAIADHLHVAAAHVTAEIGGLVEAGLLAKSAHPRDKRAVEIALTRKGRELFQRIMPMLREINDHLFAGISYGEIAMVRRFLAGIIAHGPAALRVTGAHIRAQSPGSVSSVPYARPRMS
jgi:DNA-binding MarR family transcriptional regulator